MIDKAPKVFFSQRTTQNGERYYPKINNSYLLSLLLPGYHTTHDKIYAIQNNNYNYWIMAKNYDKKTELSMVKDIPGEKDLMYKETSALIDSIQQSCDEERSSCLHGRKMNDLFGLCREYNSSMCSAKQKNHFDEETFRQKFMEFITDAFADELDDLRNGRIKEVVGNNKKKKKDFHEDEQFIRQQNVKFSNYPNDSNKTCVLKENDLKVLAHSLESCMGVWTEEEKQLFLQEVHQSENLTATSAEATSLHEHNKMELYGT